MQCVNCLLKIRWASILDMSAHYNLSSMLIFKGTSLLSQHITAQSTVHCSDKHLNMMLAGKTCCDGPSLLFLTLYVFRNFSLQSSMMSSLPSRKLTPGWHIKKWLPTGMRFDWLAGLQTVEANFEETIYTLCTVCLTWLIDYGNWYVTVVYFRAVLLIYRCKTLSKQWQHIRCFDEALGLWEFIW